MQHGSFCNENQFDGATKAVRHLNRFVNVFHGDGGLEEVLERDPKTNKQAAKSSEDFLNGVFHL